MDVKPKNLIIPAVLALGIGLIVGIFVFRANRSAPPTGPGPNIPSAPARPQRVPAPQQPAPPKPAEHRPGPAAKTPVVSEPEETVESPQSKGPTSPVPPVGEEDSWEFTREDLDAAVGRTVSVELGRYRVRVGEVFDVQVILDAPPLQAVVLAMKYDPDFLEPVPGSAVSVGSVFRKGVEFFTKPGQGRMALFCATFPGKKNVLAAVRAEVARFKLRALKAGTTQIEADTKGLKCLDGRGGALPVDFMPAEIVISGER